MGKLVGREHWNTNKFTSNWGRFARKHLKKGPLTRSAKKGILKAGMLSGTMFAYNSLSNWNSGSDDLSWLYGIVKTGKDAIRQTEISLTIIGCFIIVMLCVGCCWSCSKKRVVKAIITQIEKPDAVTENARLEDDPGSTQNY